MTRKQNCKKMIYTLLALFMLVISLIGGRGIIPAFADTSGYTSVLTDLQSDSNFDINKYPNNARDYSVNVIQIAESVNGELFLYTYQPCQLTTCLTATCINMSLNETVDGTKLYDLTLLSYSGVFAKYLVDGVKVSEKAIRYYNITSIYRLWDNTIDGKPDNDNTQNELSFPVGRVWMAKTENGQVKYAVIDTNVVVIKPEHKYVGMLRYNGGFIPFLGTYDNCDSHYVAFDCDYSIDELYSADVSYVQQRYVIRESFTVHKDKVGTAESKVVPLKGNDIGDYQGNGVNGFHKYEWKRIERVSDFISNSDNHLSSETKENLKDKQWILRFTETDWSKYSVFGGYVTECSEVSEVSILRLEFKSAGIIYNLGVVDGKQTGTNIPDNIVDDENSFQWLIDLFNKLLKAPWWVWLLVIVGIFVVVGLIISLVKWGVKAVITAILRAFWFVISAPFRFIAWLVRKIRGDD